jgi:hypothetical protein
MTTARSTPSRGRTRGLLLELDDTSHLRVRHDYFQLLTGYVFGGERRLWEKCTLRPLHGIRHQTGTPTTPTTARATSRGLAAVDGGYTTRAASSYFEMDERGRYIEAAR